MSWWCSRRRRWQWCVRVNGHNSPMSGSRVLADSDPAARERRVMLVVRLSLRRSRRRPALARAVAHRLHLHLLSRSARHPLLVQLHLRRQQHDIPVDREPRRATRWAAARSARSCPTPVTALVLRASASSSRRLRVSRRRAPADHKGGRVRHDGAGTVGHKGDAARRERRRGHRPVLRHLRAQRCSYYTVYTYNS